MHVTMPTAWSSRTCYANYDFFSPSMLLYLSDGAVNRIDTKRNKCTYTTHAYMRNARLL